MRLIIHFIPPVKLDILSSSSIMVSSLYKNHRIYEYIMSSVNRPLLLVCVDDHSVMVIVVVLVILVVVVVLHVQL